MTISMHTTGLAAKNRERAEIEAAMARSGVKPTEVAPTERNLHHHTMILLPGSAIHAEKGKTKKGNRT